MSRPPVPAELARGYLTEDLPPIAGEVREEPEDFEVEEVPLYEPSGEGQHLYLWIEKRGIPTDEAIRRLCRRLRVPRRAVGYAGLKDARAVTRQRLSVQGLDPARAVELDDEQLRVLEVRPHRNKLKVGHLRGNRFRLRVRGAGAAADTARAVLERLAARGVANYFGLQRFGRQRNTHRLGEALVREDAPAFLDELLLGEPRATFTPDPEGGRLGRARAAVAAGDFAAAVDAFPPSATAELAACRALARGRDPVAAARAVAGKRRAFYVAAYQALLFNAYLTRRLGRIHLLEAGEVVTLHRNGACFVVEDVAAEQPRADAFEVSPSGPSFGQRLLRPHEASSARALEDAVLADLAPGLGPELTPALGVKPLGQRRPLRIPLEEVATEVEGDDLRVTFFLPKGCYATAVLEELFKRQTD